MTAQRDIFTAWAQSPNGSRFLPPLGDDDFYQQYEDRQRDRWAKEEGSDYERDRRRTGARDWFAWVFCFIGMIFAGLAMWISAGGA